MKQDTPKSTSFKIPARWLSRQYEEPVEVVHKKDKKVYSLVDVFRDDGSHREELVEDDYLITPFLSSSADSADYRKDPVRALSEASHRVNFGDIAELQRVLGFDDTETARKLALDVQSRFASAIASAREAYQQKQAQKIQGDKTE